MTPQLRGVPYVSELMQVRGLSTQTDRTPYIICYCDDMGKMEGGPLRGLKHVTQAAAFAVGMAMSPEAQASEPAKPGIEETGKQKEAYEASKQRTIQNLKTLGGEITQSADRITAIRSLQLDEKNVLTDAPSLIAEIVGMFKAIQDLSDDDHLKKDFRSLANETVALQVEVRERVLAYEKMLHLSRAYVGAVTDVANIELIAGNVIRSGKSAQGEFEQMQKLSVFGADKYRKDGVDLFNKIVADAEQSLDRAKAKVGQLQGVLER